MARVTLTMTGEWPEADEAEVAVDIPMDTLMDRIRIDVKTGQIPQIDVSIDVAVVSHGAGDKVTSRKNVPAPKSRKKIVEFSPAPAARGSDYARLGKVKKIVIEA